MDIKALVADDLDSIYFGPGLDNGSTVSEFVAQIKEGVDTWAKLTIERLAQEDPELWKGVAQ